MTHNAETCGFTLLRQRAEQANAICLSGPRTHWQSQCLQCFLSKQTPELSSAADFYESLGVLLLSSVLQIFTCQFAFPCKRLISRAILEYGTDKYSIVTEWWFLYVDCRWMLPDKLPSLWYISILVGKFLECDVPHAVYVWRCLWGDDTERRRDLQGKSTWLLLSL